MERGEQRYLTYLEILRRELVPAMGCTEPVALAYCAAKARELLGTLPDRVEVEASGNIIKNVKSVIVPNTDGRKGIEAAAAIGVLAGDASRELEALSQVTQEQKKALGLYMERTSFQVTPADSDLVLDIRVRAFQGTRQAEARIVHHHTNLVYLACDGQVLLDKPLDEHPAEGSVDYGLLSVAGICDFADTVDLEDVRDILDRQIAYNTVVSDEGLRGNYGANIGKVLLDAYGRDIRTRAKARAAAGSDARMNGCELPVIINSGSGNQGMTTSLPVIEYAKELGASQEKLYRALTLSNLLAIHEKTGIGALSAYCGAVSAGAAAGAGIAYLNGGGLDAVSHTIINALAVTSGIVCDGAKASCAAKIAAAVDAGILGYEMHIRGQHFDGGDGIVSRGVEETIRNVGLLGKEGMRETDKEILTIMTCFD